MGSSYTSVRTVAFLVLLAATAGARFVAAYFGRSNEWPVNEWPIAEWHINELPMASPETGISILPIIHCDVYRPYCLIGISYRPRSLFGEFFS
jgi:hypothetical protein